ILGRFEQSGKILYRDGWLGIRNFIKHQNQNSPKIKKGIELELEKVPAMMRDFVEGKGIDTLSDTNINTNININTNTKTSAPVSVAPGVNEFIDLFKEINPTHSQLFKRKNQRDAAEYLLQLHPIEWWADFMKGYSPLFKSDQYIPKANTPLQLQAKLGHIIV